MSLRQVVGWVFNTKVIIQQCPKVIRFFHHNTVVLGTLCNCLTEHNAETVDHFFNGHFLTLGHVFLLKNKIRMALEKLVSPRPYFLYLYYLYLYPQAFHFERLAFASGRLP